MEPSPRFKAILDAVYEMQLDGKITSVEDALDQARKMIR